MDAGALAGGRRHDAAGGERSVKEGRGVSDAVGRGGDLGRVWDGADGTQRLRRLSVGLDIAS